MTSNLLAGALTALIKSAIFFFIFQSKIPFIFLAYFTYSYLFNVQDL